MTAALPSGSRIAVVDDRPDDLRDSSIAVEDAGLTPVPVVPQQVPIGEFIAHLRNLQVSGVLLDHRLNQVQPISYSGAQLAPLLYADAVAPVMRTTYRSAGEDLDLRRYRRWLPRVLSRSSDGEEVAEAFSYSASELAGLFARDREPQRSLIEVLDVAEDGGELVADVLVPAWNDGDAVRLPLVDLDQQAPVEMVSAKAWIGRRFFGEVNVWAVDPQDLYLVSIEPAVEPPADFMAEPEDA